MCDDVLVPGGACAPQQLGTDTKSVSVIRDKFQLLPPWHLSHAGTLVQITEQKGTFFPSSMDPQNQRMCLHSLAPSTGILHKLAFMYVQMKAFL